MKLTVIGSADASNSAGRGHSCYWLDGARADGALMIDFGATALMALRACGRDSPELSAIAITHLHGDHFTGLAFLLIDSVFVVPRAEPLALIGPPGLEARVDALLRVTYGSLADREPPFELSFHELAPGESIEQAGCRIEAFAASHMNAPEQPLCLRVTGADGARAAFSGDTEVCEGLLEAARGADLLVAECTGLAPPAGRHITWEDWKELLPRVEARAVLLSHLHRVVRERVEELSRFESAGPPFRFASDGLQLEVEAGA